MWGNEVVGKDHLVLAQLVKRVGSAGEHHKHHGRGVQQLSCLLAAQTPRNQSPSQRRSGASRADRALVSLESLHSLLHSCPLRARFPTWQCDVGMWDVICRGGGLLPWSSITWRESLEVGSTLPCHNDAAESVISRLGGL